MIAQLGRWQATCQRLISNGRLHAMRIFRQKSHSNLPEIKRPRAVTASSRIMFVEALVFLFLTWLVSPEMAASSLAESWLALLFFFLGVYALLTSLNFLRMRPAARNRAMLAQAFTLTLTLFLYSSSRPVFMYPLMVLSIFIVLYLQHPDVRESFPYDYELRKEKNSK